MNLDFLENIAAPKKADPKRVRRKHMRSRDIHISMKVIIGVFVSAIALLAVVSVYTVASERSKVSETTVAGVVSGETDSAEAVAAPAVTDKGESEFSGNFLLAFTREGTKDLRLLAVVNADSQSGRVKISYIPVTMNCTANNHNEDMIGHFEDGGITELLWAVNDAYNIDIARYIYCDEGDFVDIMKYIGEIPVTVEEDVSHSYNGINFIIEEGTRNFTSDMFLKYFVYLCDTYNENTLKLTEMLMLFARNLICFNDETTPETTYDKLINYISTDISAIDISNYLPAIRSIIQEGGLESVEFVSDASLLSLENEN